MNTIHDVIIIGAGAAGLFAAINIPKKYNKLLLEKNAKPGIKVLLSGGERANVSNIDIEGERDYFGQNKKCLRSIFARYNQRDIQSFFAENGVSIIEEDRGRLILESGDSKELLELLVRKAKDNNSEIKMLQDVVGVEMIEEQRHNSAPTPNHVGVNLCVHHKNGIYSVTTKSGEEYFGKHVIVSSGGKSFFQVGTTGEGYNFAESFGLNIIPPTRALGGLSTKKDLSDISGSSCVLELKVFDKNNPAGEKTFQRKVSTEKGCGNISLKHLSNNPKHLIYSETGPLLFTHFGVSGPIVFNAGNAIGEHISNTFNKKPSFFQAASFNKGSKSIEELFEDYLKSNISIELTFTLKNTPKKVIKFFSLDILLNKNGIQIENNIINLELQNWRSWKEAKATGGGVDLDELDKYMQSKKHDGLFFIGEVCDITGKTGGFNLQWAWSSAYCCSEYF